MSALSGRRWEDKLVGHFGVFGFCARLRLEKRRKKAAVSIWYHLIAKPVRRVGSWLWWGRGESLRCVGGAERVMPPDKNRLEQRFSSLVLPGRHRIFSFKTLQFPALGRWPYRYTQTSYACRFVDVFEVVLNGSFT